MEMLWLYVGDHHHDGNLSSLSDDEIELAAEWDGARGAFVAAALECRLLDRLEDGIHVHDWIDWRQRYVELRDSRRKNKDLQPKTAHTERRTAHNVRQCPPELNRIELNRTEESIPPTPLFKGGGETLVDTGKPKSSKRAKRQSEPPLEDWESAFAAFCDGAGLNATERDDWEFPTREWFEHKKSRGEPLRAIGWRSMGRRHKKMGSDRFRAAVDLSIERQWQGVFELKEGGNGHNGHNGKPVCEPPPMLTYSQMKERGLL